jgi:hypothetical protein
MGRNCAIPPDYIPINSVYLLNALNVFITDFVSSCHVLADYSSM